MRFSSLSRRGALGASIAIIAIVWLAVLPRLGKTPRLAEAINLLEEKGVDPNALFYTDHPSPPSGRSWPSL